MTVPPIVAHILRCGARAGEPGLTCFVAAGDKEDDEPSHRDTRAAVRRRAGAWLLLAVALASLAALSGGLPAGAAADGGRRAGARPAPARRPWETAGPFPSAFDLRTAGA